MEGLKEKNINGFKIYFRNKQELAKLEREIFVKEEYRTVFTKEDPLIIDCGGHIGVSVLYFKKISPLSRVIAFEPNLENFEILSKNVKVNRLTHVKLINAAV